MTEEEYYIKKYEIGEWQKCFNDPKYFINNYVNYSTAIGQRRLKLYPHQRDIVDLYNSNNRVIGNVSRQSGTTSTTLSYILWYSLFNYDKTVVLVGSSYERSKMLLNNLLVSFLLLPDFLKMAIENKRTTEFVQLSNRVKIHAVPISSAATRGISISLLYVDDAAYCKDDSFRNFMSSTWPCISAQNGQIIITSTPYQIDSLFYDLWCKSTDKGIGNLGSNGFLPYQVKWDCVPGRDENFKSMTINNFGEDMWARDYDCQFISK